MSRGVLFIISAPSGTGKTTILKRILATVPGVAFSISHTTRKPRSGEQDGIDYHFVDRATFEEMRDQQAFLEWAEVHGNLYGTGRDTVEACLKRGEDIILDIDVQGAKQVRTAKGDTGVFVFIAPPSWDELAKRLTGRGTESEESLAIRRQNARREMAEIDMYDYVVVNDRLDEAVDTLRAIIVAERSRRRRLGSGQPVGPF